MANIQTFSIFLGTFGGVRNIFVFVNCINSGFENLPTKILHERS